MNITVVKSKHARVNRAINAPQVLLIGPEGKQVGVVNLKEALYQAEETGLDLVEIAPQADPPVCKIMDYGKYLFEQSKRHKQKAKRVHIKELKLRPVTEEGDYNVKLRKAIAFLELGDKVKFTVRFRGREMAHHQLGVDMLNRIEQDLQEYGVVVQQAKFEGRQMVMVVAPKRNK